MVFKGTGINEIIQGDDGVVWDERNPSGKAWRRSTDKDQGRTGRRRNQEKVSQTQTTESFWT